MTDRNTSQTDNIFDAALTCCTSLITGICILGFIALSGWMIVHGEDLIIRDRAFKPGNAIEADCTVLHRTSKKCSCGKGCGSRIYSYLANSTACPGITLSTAKKEQKCRRKNMKTYKENDDVHKCYIDSCESGKFVFDFRANRSGGYTVLIIGCVLACFCGCAALGMFCQCVEYLCRKCMGIRYDAVSKADENDVDMGTITHNGEAFRVTTQR